MPECLDPRSRERSCGSQDQRRDRIWVRDQLPGCERRGLLRPAAWRCWGLHGLRIVRPYCALSWRLEGPGPAWLPDQRLQLITQKQHRVICRKTEQGLWSCFQLPKMRDIGVTPDSRGGRCLSLSAHQGAAEKQQRLVLVSQSHVPNHDSGREGPSVPLPSQHIPYPCWAVSQDLLL